MKSWCKAPSRGTGAKEIANKNSIKSHNVGNILVQIQTCLSFHLSNSLF